MVASRVLARALRSDFDARLAAGGFTRLPRKGYSYFVYQTRLNRTADGGLSMEINGRHGFAELNAYVSVTLHEIERALASFGGNEYNPAVASARTGLERIAGVDRGDWREFTDLSTEAEAPRVAAYVWDVVSRFGIPWMRHRSTLKRFLERETAAESSLLSPERVIIALHLDDRGTDLERALNRYASAFSPGERRLGLNVPAGRFVDKMHQHLAHCEGHPVDRLHTV